MSAPAPAPSPAAFPPPQSRPAAAAQPWSPTTAPGRSSSRSRCWSRTLTPRRRSRCGAGRGGRGVAQPRTRDPWNVGSEIPAWTSPSSAPLRADALSLGVFSPLPHRRIHMPLSASWTRTEGRGPPPEACPRKSPSPPPSPAGAGCLRTRPLPPSPVLHPPPSQSPPEFLSSVGALEGTGSSAGGVRGAGR